ncbi:HTH-type transcriptional regulator / antitoxin HipB [Nocardioides alpinus]|uniref:HTH-type transcriptional regulator / antitoxin HipB n=1 Tax=Nocardioides alpinus TaxID=748909 RepID=A0A1I0YMQ0_9ACTN|nr:helix-turn-helix transcriptional regulator [Nocardioides alpinus]PKH43557.1 XRE family transcriptional regulator [Nocardioides alpinus]SFB13403.1 HTH-type transcriptional regulator / antitoxin HipB [Nocardioides alpinus]
MDAEFDWMEMDGWTDAEVEYYLMGPFDGGIPGLVRRIRRILNVSQRGLAAVLDVSQSVVARWETGRTSPRADVIQGLLVLAGLRASFHSDDSGEEVEPMRDDGARDRAGRRFPAHVDLTVTGWWCPRSAECTADVLAWRTRSRARRDPAIRFHTSLKRLYRLMYGTPDDHPAHHQLVAEAVHLDDRREQRRRQILAEQPWLRPPPGWLAA